mmetsp:Transcript_4762/g.13726  ORF Transcript_4762/g.13726 Transcript_4762/m.13726 type:complete len:252 (+) Transcript_4762:1532-2287(+)
MELSVLAFDASHFNLGSFEIASQHMAQTGDGRPNDLVALVLLHFCGSLFQVVHRLLLLGSGRGGEEGKVMPRTIHLEHLRTFVVVDAHEQSDACQRAHRRRLRVDLRQVGHAAGQDADGHGVPVVEVELAGLVPRPLHHRAGVGHGARHAAADVLGQREQVRDAGRVHQPVRHLLLCHHAARVLAAHGHPGQAGIGALEAVLHLVQPALRREDGDVVVIVGIAAHDCRWSLWFESMYDSDKLWDGCASQST